MGMEEVIDGKRRSKKGKKRKSKKHKSKKKNKRRRGLATRNAKRKKETQANRSGNRWKEEKQQGR